MPAWGHNGFTHNPSSPILCVLAPAVAAAVTDLDAHPTGQVGHGVPPSQTLPLPRRDDLDEILPLFFEAAEFCASAKEWTIAMVSG